MRPTYDDNCAAPSAPTSCAHRAAENHGVSDHMPASEGLATSSDAGLGFTTSAFDMESSGSTTRDGVVVRWGLDHRSGGFWAGADGQRAFFGDTARAAVDAAFGALSVSADSTQNQSNERCGEHALNVNSNDRKGQ